MSRKLAEQYVIPDGKVCTLCAEYKTLNDYGVQKTTRDGRKSRCKSCSASLSRKYNVENPEKRRNAEREWRKNNPLKVKEMARRSRINNAEGYKLRLREFYKQKPKRIYSAIRRARKRSLPYDYSITHSELMYDIFGGCALTGDRFNLHDDHFIAISTGHGGAFIGNMIPLSASLNESKGAQNPFEWIKTRDDVDMTKFDKTVRYLAQLNGMSVDEYREYVYYCYDNPRKIAEVNAC
jgi:hypothetical protein